MPLVRTSSANRFVLVQRFRGTQTLNHLNHRRAALSPIIPETVSDWLATTVDRPHIDADTLTSTIAPAKRRARVPALARGCVLRGVRVLAATLTRPERAARSWGILAPVDMRATVARMFVLRSALQPDHWITDPDQALAGQADRLERAVEAAAGGAPGGLVARWGRLGSPGKPHGFATGALAPRSPRVGEITPFHSDSAREGAICRDHAITHFRPGWPRSGRAGLGHLLRVGRAVSAPRRHSPMEVT